MVFFQDQTEKLVFCFMEKATWFPEDGKKVMSEWSTVYKKGLESFKAYTDENYKKAADYFANFPSQEERKNKGKS